MPDPVARLVVYSDYLCPWCNVAAVRLRMLASEYGDRLSITWKSFLLRPRPEQRTLDEFRAYTKSWLRPAAEEPAATFRVWATDDGPPTHSVPPHLAAKAAAHFGSEAFRRMHDALLNAYFVQNRDVTREATLRALWAEVGLPEAEFDRVSDPGIADQVIAEHNDAVRSGITGVPTAMLAGGDAAIPGALPLDVYRRWIERALAAG